MNNSRSTGLQVSSGLQQAQ